MENNELYHHGVKGMRWGVRRYQNKDGSLTSAGKKRYDNDQTKKKLSSINSRTAAKIKKIRAEGKAKLKIAKAEAKAAAKIAKEEAKYQTKSKTTSETKSIKDMTDDELRQRINRIRLEKELKSLQPEQVSAGKKFVTSLRDNVVGPAARDAGKRLLTDFLNKKGAEILGLNKKDLDNGLDVLSKEVKKMNLEKQKNELNKYWADEKAKSKKDTADTESKPKEEQKKTTKDDLDDGSKKTNKNERKSAVDEEPEIIGNGTSRNKNPFSDKKETVIDVDFTEVNMNDTSTTRPLISAGKNYINDLLLIERE